MEDPAKRRERLLALRTQASQTAGAPPNQQTTLLPEPLFSSSPAATAERARFDYYTNPSAAFSGSYNKRKNETFMSNESSSSYTRPNVGPRQSPMPPFQPPFNATPHQQWRSPVQSQSRGGFANPNPNFIRGCRPNQSPNPNFYSGPGHIPNPNPNFYLGPRHSPNHNPNFYSGPRTNPNPNFQSGSRGRGGRGGLGFNNRFSRSDYYSKSMVEDPWIQLEPIAGKLIGSLSESDSGSWVPESIRKTESRKLDQGGNGSSNNNKYEKKLSLAEYLDLSFNQAVGET